MNPFPYTKKRDNDSLINLDNAFAMFSRGDPDSYNYNNPNLHLLRMFF